MGCSSSAIAPEGESTKDVQVDRNKDIPPTVHNKSNGHAKPPQVVNEEKKVGHEKLLKQNSTVDKNANKLSAMDQTPVPKSIAFDVSFDGEETLPAKRKPARLLTLEPLNVTRLTAEQLAEKQRLADEKRERIRQKKINKSQKSSRHRKELLRAKEFEKRQQIEQEKNNLDDTIRQADMKREQRLLEIKEKQRIREERAKRARERAKKIQNPDEEVEVEKDDQFNANSDESWLDNSNSVHAEKEEEDPQKRVSGQSNLRPTASASTVDSYDAAFMRTKTHERVVFDDGALGDDDFFGS